MLKVTRAYVTRADLGRARVSFSFQGIPLEPGDTAQALGLVTHDAIDAVVEEPEADGSESDGDDAAPGEA
eukprot:9655986-Alexandrium_andersonii.AAC.1